MNYKTLGNSGVKVSELILGCWAMGGDYFGETEDKNSLEAIHKSYELGVNTLDTAEIYGKGRSEKVVGQAAKEIGRDKLAIISKVFKPSMKHDKMIKACEDSLQRLGTDYLDVYFLHYPVPNEEVSIQERMGTMMELKKSGKIRAIGLSNFSIEEMKEAMQYGDVDVIQPCYSLLWRYDEALLRFSLENNVGVIPYSTLAQGLLAGKYKKDAVFTDGRSKAALFQPENYNRCLEVTDVLARVSAKYDRTPAQGAIRWLLQTPGITAPIVGAKNALQAQENIKASGWEFSMEDYEAINKASLAFTNSLPNYTLFFNTEVAD
jgi:myo-inositol catabolism protein IolS